MVLRKLTPEEEVVFGLIVKQREKSKSNSDYFIYDIVLGQKILQDTGQAVEYGIGPTEQREIIHKLAQDGIIKADRVVKHELHTDGAEPEFGFELEATGFVEYQKFTERYDIPLLPFEYDDKYWENRYFICISFSEIKTINDNCVTRHLCALSYDDQKCQFVIKCDNGKKYILQRIRKESLPFEVLKIAVKTPNKIIDKDDLRNTSNGRIHISKKSIRTQVFDRNSVVRNELSHFVKLTSDSIYVTPNVELTLTQVAEIRKACF